MKLTSGKEVELRPLTFLEKNPIKDLFYSYAYKGENQMPLFTAAVKCLMSIGFKEAELETWTDADIMEAGNWVLENSGLTETQKKS